MPLSKRNKKVSLTKTEKKGKDFKKHLISEVQACVDKYKYVYVLSVSNARNNLMKDVRQQWSHSRFLFGKNKLMGFALGKTKESEYRENLHQVGEILRGQTGLLFTDLSKKDVINWFENHSVEEFARSGNVATYTVVLQPGLIPAFGQSIEPQLRALGLPTSIDRGIVKLLKSHTVCKTGDVLKPEQGRILKLFGHKMAMFHIKVEGMWSKKTSKFQLLKSEKDSKAPVKDVVHINVEDLQADDKQEAEQDDDDKDEEMGEEM